MNLIILLSSYCIIILSVMGYSLLLHSVFKKTLNLEFEYSFLAALFFLIVISFFTHLFFKHDYSHNIIILFIGITSFFLFIKRQMIMLNKYLKFIFPIFGILIIALLAAKTHDDFPYYHFPYTYYLTQEKLIIGVGNLNHGFRTPSSIFYINSLFYLPIIKYYSFHFAAIFILGISNLILIFKLKSDYENKKYDFIFILTLLSFLFINIFFYRISEHGTDRSAQILIFILFIEVLSLLRKNIIFEKFFSKIFILLGIIISLKAFYVLYLLIFVPIFYYIPKKKFKGIIKNFFSNFYFYLFILVGFFLVATNIFNSGCILYPVSITCLPFLEWSLVNEVEAMNNWYEQWSKAGATPNFRVDNPENYIKGFNWVSNWIDLYFFNKVLDFLAGILFITTVVFFIFYSKNKTNFIIDKKIYITYSIILILFFEWFYNHPSLRYGGYNLIALIIFIPFTIYISRFISKKYLKQKIIFLIVLTLIIFVGRNFNRIHKEIDKYNYDIILHPFYIVDQNHFRIDVLVEELIEGYENCLNKSSTNCKSHKEIYVGKKKNYYYFVTKND